MKLSDRWYRAQYQVVQLCIRDVRYQKSDWSLLTCHRDLLQKRRRCTEVMWSLQRKINTSYLSFIKAAALMHKSRPHHKPQHNINPGPELQRCQTHIEHHRYEIYLHKTEAPSILPSFPSVPSNRKCCRRPHSSAHAHQQNRASLEPSAVVPRMRTSTESALGASERYRVSVWIVKSFTDKLRRWKY